MADDTDDPYVAAGRRITGGEGKDAAPASDDPYVAAGRTITSQIPTVTVTASRPPPASSGDTVAPGIRDSLAPAPNTTYGSILPFARDDTTGALRMALPSSLRDVATGALDLAESPMTGYISPEGTNALAQVMMGGAYPSVARGTGADILPTLGRNAPKPPPDVPPAAPISGVNPVDPDLATRAAQTAGPTADVPPQPSPAPAPQDMPRTVTTSDDAKKVANAWYKVAEAKGHDSSLTPEYSGKLLDDAMTSTQGEAGKAVAGDNAVTALQARLQTLRGKPLSLQDAQDMDEQIGGLITKEYGLKGLSKEGQQLEDIQKAWRDRINAAGPGDITGGQEGFDALAPARQAWSTAMKMADVERIQARADATQNPTTSFATQINNLINSATKSRGYSDEDIAALKAAADRGKIGTVLHALGNRLIPIAAGATEAGTGGLTGGLAAAMTAHYVGGAFRDAGNALQTARINKAYRILGRNAGPPPPGSTFAPGGPPSGANALFQGVSPTAPMAAPGAYQGATTTLPNALWPGA
jgi:hypothetical protein